MADISAEEAFLQSMKEAADAEAVQYEAEGANGKQTESTSSDEYDPAQAVPDIFSPNPAQDHLLSPGVVRQNSSLQSPDRPSSAATGNVSATGPQDQAAYDDDGRSQSRSMSDSSSSSSSPVNIQTSNVPFSMDVSTKSATEENSDLSDPQGFAGAEPQSSAVPFVNSTSDDAAKQAQSQTHVPEQSVSGIVLNGAVHAASDPPVSLSEAASEAQTQVAAETAPEHSTLQPSDRRAPAIGQQKAAPAVALPKARLPNDTIGILEDRIQEDPRGDVNAWLNLIDEYRNRGKLEDARATYERFFLVFPAAAEQWVAYMQMENDANNLAAKERIMGTTLQGLPNLRLWSTYLDHVRRRNDVTRDTTGQSRKTITDAYEAALEHIGIDKDSGYLWQEYIQFLKSRPGETGGQSWQGQQKMDQLREAYRKAIKVPTQATVPLWKEYDQFEMAMNKATGRKFLMEESADYVTARQSYIQVSNITRNLRRITLPSLPPALGFDGDREYAEQLDIWKQWIQWEKEDPLVFLKAGTESERQKWRNRVVFVYKQAVMAMRFWPEMWFEAANFCFENEMESVGSEFLMQGIDANPESCLLAFKRADRIELTTPNEESDDGVARRGVAVREPYDKVLDALYDLITKTKVREARELAKIEAEYGASGVEQPEGNKEDDDDNTDEEEVDNKEKRKAAQLEVVKAGTAMQITLLSKIITSAWIALMRAMRRVQGKGKVGDKVGGSRQIFTDARKRGRLLHEMYVASAMIEYHCYEPEAAKRIFERGLKLFPEEETFALEYIKHLMLTNDLINARVIFETVVNRLTSKPATLPKAKPLYAFFHDFESKYGELTQIIKLEKRMREHFPDDPTLSAFSRRFVQPGVDPTAIRPIISPAVQTRPKGMVVPDSSLPVQGSPTQRGGYQANSPKRAFPLDDSDNDNERPRKLARGESPLKGAAGRRLEQQKRGQQPQGTPQFDHALPQPPPPTLPHAVTHLLGILPRASLYPAHLRFIPEKAVSQIQALDFTKQDRQLPIGSSQSGPPPSTAHRRQLHQLGPPMHQPMPQHPQSMPSVPTMGMSNPYTGGYSTSSPSSYKQPASPFPPQQQAPMVPNNLHFPGSNGQAPYGSVVHGAGYTSGQAAPGQYYPYNR